MRVTETQHSSEAQYKSSWELGKGLEDGEIRELYSKRQHSHQKEERDFRRVKFRVLSFLRTLGVSREGSGKGGSLGGGWPWPQKRDMLSREEKAIV